MISTATTSIHQKTTDEGSLRGTRGAAKECETAQSLADSTTEIDTLDATEAIAAVLEAAQYLSGDPKARNLSWELIAWAQCRAAQVARQLMVA